MILGGNTQRVENKDRSIFFMPSVGSIQRCDKDHHQQSGLCLLAAIFPPAIHSKSQNKPNGHDKKFNKWDRQIKLVRTV